MIINQTIQSMYHEDSSDLLNMDDYRSRRRWSLLQHEDHYDDNTSKRPIHQKESNPTIHERQIGQADREDEKEQQYRAAVDSLGPYDVICGRGSVAFNNIGNRRFRVLIGMNVDRYNDSEGRYRKGLFIGSLVNTFRNTIGARFFKLKDGQLIELNERQIRQKVGHALRDVLAFQESQNKQRQQIQKSKQKQTPAKRSGSRTSRKTRPAKSMATHEATLSSIRSRLDEIRDESKTIKLQDDVIAPPLPFRSTTSHSPRTEMRQDSSDISTHHHRSHHYQSNDVIANAMFGTSTHNNRICTATFKNDTRSGFTCDANNTIDSLEPIPIDDHQEPDDEAITNLLEL